MHRSKLHLYSINQSRVLNATGVQNSANGQFTTDEHERERRRQLQFGFRCRMATLLHNRPIPAAETVHGARQHVLRTFDIAKGSLRFRRRQSNLSPGGILVFCELFHTRRERRRCVQLGRRSNLRD